MPKAVPVPLGCVAIILITSSALGMWAFPLVLVITSPTQATADFLGVLVLVSVALSIAGSVFLWLRNCSRPGRALQPQFPVGRSDAMSLLWGCLLCLFHWSRFWVQTLGLLTALFIGLVLFVIGIAPLLLGGKGGQQAQQQAALPEQEHAPARRRVHPMLLFAWGCLSVVLGYLLFFLTITGRFSAFLTPLFSYQPLFGPVPVELLGGVVLLILGCMRLVTIPASLRGRSRRQRFLFLLARRLWGALLVLTAAWLFYKGIYQPTWENDSFLGLFGTVAGISALTYLAAWVVVGRIKWREFKQNVSDQVAFGR